MSKAKGGGKQPARGSRKVAAEKPLAAAPVPEPPEPQPAAYDAAANSAGSYAVAIAAIRLKAVKEGRLLPLPDRPEEIASSPIVEDVKRVGDATLFLGDSTRIVALLAEQGSAHGWIDACVTDPPYELGFMGKAWDATGVAARWETWGGVRIALKPGGHLVAFAGSRTYHRIARAIDDAGFEVRDQLMWIYGSGFPKSMDVSKALDKKAGKAHERGYVPTTGGLHGGSGNTVGKFTGQQLSDVPVTAAAAAAAWQGWGTALKPAHEPVCFARKPLGEKTVAENVLRWATGAINIDGARVNLRPLADPKRTSTAYGSIDSPGGKELPSARWPANVMHDGSLEVFEAFPPSARDAVRFFYSAKAGKDEREEGLAGTAAIAQSADSGARGGRASEPRANIHPTVKPVDLMRWLCRLVTPAGGIVLDPFMGSGSTGVAAIREGMQFIGVEQSRDYFEIAHARIAAAVSAQEQQPDLVNAITREVVKMRGGKGGGQGDMF